MARFRGTARADLFSGSDGNDTVSAGAGNDTIYGEYGDDVLKGGAGNDIVAGGAGVDRVYGGRGDDQLMDAEGYGNRLEGAGGNDNLLSVMLNDSWNELVGGRGADTFVLDFLTFDSVPGSHSWTDVLDFRAADGDKLQLCAVPAPGVALASADTFASFDSNRDGSIDDADASTFWDGRALQVSTDTATIVLWQVDHISYDMLIG